MGGRDYVNGTGNNRWRDDEAGAYRGGPRGGRGGTAFGRQRSRHEGYSGGDLPEWALDDEDDRSGAMAAGGTFDSSGKFRAPSSESPPPSSSSRLPQSGQNGMLSLKIV